MGSEQMLGAAQPLALGETWGSLVDLYGEAIEKPGPGVGR
jgi:hypothetical protein